MKSVMKRSFFIVCFFLLNFIDLLRHTQNGHIGSTAANLTGVVIFFLVMSGLKFSRKCALASVVWTVLWLIFVRAGVQWYHSKPQPLWIWNTLAVFLNIWCIGVMVITLIGNRGRDMLKNRRISMIGILWVCFSVLAVLSRYGIFWPVWYLFMFACFYGVDYNEEKKEFLFAGMVDGTILAFFAFQIYAYGFRPWDMVRYLGAYANCNMTALHYVVVFCMLLVKLHVLEKNGAKKWIKLLYAFLAGGLISFQIFTICRTALLTSAALLLVYGIVVVGCLWKKKVSGVFFRGCLLAACIAVSFPLVYATIRYLPAVLHHPVWYIGEYNVEKVHSYDAWDSPKYTDFDEFMETAFGRFFRIKKEEEEAGQSPTEPSTEAKTELLQNTGTEPAQGRTDEGTVQDAEEESVLETALGGREAVYRAYLTNLNWTGHTEQEGYFQITEDWHTWHAQNHWLQAAFYLGIPAGVLLFVMTVLICIRNLRIAVRNQKDNYAILPLMVTVVFLVFGMAELVWYPGQMILVLFFLVQHPQFKKGVHDEKEKILDSAQ